MKDKPANVNPIIITIDGLAGSGKSTVAGKIAKKLALIHLNSGLLYRSVGLLAVDRKISLADEKALVELVRESNFQFYLKDSGETGFKVNGQDLSLRLTTEEAAELASKVAVLPELRAELCAIQRSVSKNSSVVLEGRDAGTVVFPNAQFKFFLEASLEERARRRLKDEQEKLGNKITLAEVVADISKRDLRDTTRKIAPSVKAKDALLIKTDGLTVEEVVKKIEDLVI